MYEMTAAGPRKEKIAQAAALAAAREEEVRQLEDRLEKFTIKAPFQGFVISKHSEAGSWIKRGGPVVDMVEIDPMEVTVAVPEFSIPALTDAARAASEAGEPLTALAKIDSLPGRPFVAQLEKIVPQADLRTRTFPVKLVVPNPRRGEHHELLAGMICHIVLPLGRTQEAILIPKDALVLGGPAPLVYVAEADAFIKHVARAMPVQIGTAHGSLLAVTGELQPGMLVITRGNERVMPGQSLQILKGTKQPATERQATTERQAEEPPAKESSSNKTPVATENAGKS
jgi:RND family efflux transporter MFP subunit